MNQILSNMQTVHTKSEYDKAYKTVLSSKEILLIILKNTTEELHDVDCDHIKDYCIEGNISNDIPLHKNEGDFIIGMNNEDSSTNEGTVYFDIVFYVRTPNKEQIKIIINIEAQKTSPPYSIIKRAIYYSSRLMSSQYGREFTKSHYEKSDMLSPLIEAGASCSRHLMMSVSTSYPPVSQGSNNIYYICASLSPSSRILRLAL